MQAIKDVAPGSGVTVMRPFGPVIIKATIPQSVQDILCDKFENNSDAADHSPNLAGNMKREFTIDDQLLNSEEAQQFIDMLAQGSAELYKYSKQIQWESTRYVATDLHREIVETRLNDMNLNCIIHQSWGNISVAGDFNPIHSHTGAISGVGYLRLPDDIEAEWANEDHDPSAGMIQFTHGNPLNLSTHSLRLKPEVGVIYFFPAWMLHEVYPFRSKGERWSFSFNTTIENLNPDVDLTAEDKEQLYNAR